MKKRVKKYQKGGLKTTVSHNDSNSGRDIFNQNSLNYSTINKPLIIPTDKESLEFYTKLKNYAFPDTWNEIEAIGKKYGLPKITTEKGKGIFKNAPAHYNPLSETITIPNFHEEVPIEFGVSRFISELAHHVQFKESNFINKGGQWLANDFPNYAKDFIYHNTNLIHAPNPKDYPGTKKKYREDAMNFYNSLSPYKDSNSVEYEAHQKIEPKLMARIFPNSAYNYRPMLIMDTYQKGGNTSESYYSQNQRSIPNPIKNFPGQQVTRRDDNFYGNFLSGFVANGIVGDQGNSSTDSYNALRHLYAGKPIDKGVVTISNYKPSKSTDPNATYYAINDSATKQFLLDMASHIKQYDGNFQEGFKESIKSKYPKGWKPIYDRFKDESKNEGVITNLGNGRYNIPRYYTPPGSSGRSQLSALGNYQINFGNDEKGDYISYYDLWDTKGGAEPLGSGKPLEVYDRVYYDKKNGKELPNQPINTTIPKITTYQKGGFSTQGYKRNSPDRNNPYNIIPSNRLTMKNVKFPIFAQADNGESRIMYPDEEHYFPGARSVKEIPIKQDGGKQMKYLPPGTSPVGTYKPKLEGKAINFYNTLNFRKWGKKDYSDAKSFNEAFRAAREAEDEDFVYNDNRYNTKLADKEASNEYWNSKNFLKNYYKADTSINQSDFYDKWEKYSKEKFGTTWSEEYDKIKNLPQWINMGSKFDSLNNELNKRNDYDNLGQKKINDKDFKAWNNSQPKEEIKNLDEPTYFSMAKIPENQGLRGQYNVKNKSLYVGYTPGEENGINTTYVHELTHKANTPIFTLMHKQPTLDMNKLNESTYGKQLSQERFNYINNPQEIEARKMSTLYYLNKIGKPYTNIPKERLDSLYQNIYNSPTDVKDLLRLYDGQRGDLLNYLNSKKMGGIQKFQPGGGFDPYKKQREGLVTNPTFGNTSTFTDQAISPNGNFFEPKNNFVSALDYNSINNPMTANPPTVGGKNTKEKQDLSFLPIFASSILAALSNKVEDNRQRNYVQTNLSNPFNYIPLSQNQDYGMQTYQYGGQAPDEGADEEFLWEEDPTPQNEEETVEAQTAAQPQEEPQEEVVPLDTDYSDQYNTLDDTTETGSTPSYMPTSGVELGSNHADAFSYLLTKGISPIAAAGIVGNLVQESGLGPNIVGDNGNGKGIAQWHQDRYAGLQQYAQTIGKSPEDIYTQLDYLVMEAQQRGDLDLVNQATTPKDAAYLFAKHYERPAQIEQVRMDTAEKLYQNYINKK